MLSRLTARGFMKPNTCSFFCKIGGATLAAWAEL
jgi:hypothetical protein